MKETFSPENLQEMKAKANEKIDNLSEEAAETFEELKANEISGDIKEGTAEKLEELKETFSKENIDELKAKANEKLSDFKEEAAEVADNLKNKAETLLNVDLDKKAEEASVAAKGFWGRVKGLFGSK